MTDKNNPEKAAKELTMLLMYLTRFNERSRFESDLDMAWKGYDFDIINELDEEGYIRQGSHRSKSVHENILNKIDALKRDVRLNFLMDDWNSRVDESGRAECRSVWYNG